MSFVLVQLGAFAQWETVHYPGGSTPTLPQLHAGEFVDKMNGIAVGRDNVGPIIMKTKDGGNTWSEVYHKKYELAANFCDIHFTNDSTAFVIGRNWQNDTSFIATTTDLGLTWKIKHIYARRFQRIFFSSSLTGYVVGDHGKIFKTSDGGKNWTDISLAKRRGLMSVHFTSDTVGYVTASDTIFKTVDGGRTWTNTALGETEGSHCTVFFPSEKIGYCEYQTNKEVGLDETIIYKTLDAGKTWKKQSSFGSFNFNARMIFLNEKVGYIVGFFKVFKTVDGGLNWKKQTSSKPSFGNFYDNATDICFPNNETGFIVGYDQFYRLSGASSISPIEANSSQQIQVFPNPFSDYTLITFNVATGEEHEFILMDMQGRAVLRKTGLKSGEIRIDRGNLGQGLYLYALRSTLGHTHRGRLMIE